MIQHQNIRMHSVTLGNFLTLLLIIAVIAPIANAGMGFATTDLFVDVAWLKKHRSEVLIVDARSEKDFGSGHIPGAVSAPWQQFARMEGKPGDPAWGTLLPKDQLAAKFGALGLDGRQPLVVYSNLPGWGEDGRFAWMTEVLGVKDVKILDGGFKAWKSAGGETTREINALPGREPLATIELHEDLVATAEFILAGKGSMSIVDSRTEKEFKGATKYGEARGGHLPGAISIPFETMFGDDGKIKSRAELEQLFRAAGLRPEDDIVIYCTAGIRSAHMALVLRMIGFEKARNYDASFYEWAAMKHLPVQR